MKDKIFMRERYINSFTDFGFKRLFGEEPNKDLLLDFLNELLRKEKGNIKSITYLKNEHLPYFWERKAIFDIYSFRRHNLRFPNFKAKRFCKPFCG